MGWFDNWVHTGMVMTFDSYRTALRAAISGETKAYGFTLVIWGTAAISEAERGSPGIAGVIAFVAGALCGMAMAILISFGHPGATWKPQHLRRHVFGAIHLVSVAVALVTGWCAAAAVGDKVLGYLAAGALAVIVYQLVLGFEVAVSAAGSNGENSNAAEQGSSSSSAP